MKKNYYAKALALTVAASMVSVPAFAAEETDPQAQEETVEKDEQEEPEAEEQGIVTYSEEDEDTDDTVEIITEGICGGTSEDEITDSAKWKLTENGDDTYTLTIRGEGEVFCNPNKLAADNTWKSVAGKISVIRVEEGITVLGTNLICDTNAVTVYLPASLESLTMLENGAATFGNNAYTAGVIPTGIQKIVVAEGNQNYKMVDGVLFNMDETVLIKYTNEAAKDYVVPDDVVELSPKAFARSGHIRSLKLNEGLVKIGADCFDKSEYIEEMVIPASVETLGSYCFTAMPSLKSITFKNPNLDGYSSIASDNDNVMYPVTVNLPDGVKKIPDLLFSGMKPLKEIVLPDSVEEIGERAFQYCENLEKITIGKNIKKIDASAFYRVPLESLVISTENDLELASLGIYSNSLKEVFIESTNGNLTVGNGIAGGVLTYATLRGKTVDFVGIPFSTSNTVDSKLHTLNMTGVETIRNSFTNPNHNSDGTMQTSSGIWYLAPTNTEFVNRGIIYLSSESAKESLEEALESKESSKRKHVDAITNGGTFAKNTVFEGGKLATPTKEGYAFDGWYDNADFNGNAVTEVEAPDAGVNYRAYYAKWHKAATLTTDIGEQDFTIGEPVEFTFTTTANEDADTMVLGTFDFSDPSAIEKLEYYETKDGNWYEFNGDFGPSTGFPMSDATSKFRVTFKKAGNYTLTASMKKVAGEDVLCSTKVDLTVNKKTQAAPAAPEAESITRTSITLKAVEPNRNNAKAQYKINDGEWQDNPVFTGLSARTTYTFAVRYAETGEYAASAASETAQFTTRKKASSSSSDTSAPTYGVSTGKTENGEISVTPAKAEAGEKVTIKATPDSGYQLDKITVKDKNNSTVKLTKVDENEYTFTMPSGKVSVDATFARKDATDDNTAAETGKTIKLQIGSRIVNVDNEAVIYDVAPVIRNDRTLVPIRIITETLGGKVDWNGATKEVTLTLDGREIKMTIGKTLEKYGVAPVIIDGRTFVPVRFVADELGATVAWDDATKTVTIKTAR